MQNIFKETQQTLFPLSVDLSGDKQLIMDTYHSDYFIPIFTLSYVVLAQMISSRAI